ncbi:hypothetical protein DFR70_102962 [Nocardia tenerifensis]|uniref:Uncharacterized protein n=1 Tax=Nocardia tenerifensis TaxID=228006 RepID=A0A318K8Q2_9NOCA|nr:hypothetical protein DFR70_102962 [Nocardia tenerifensis]
MGDQGSTERKTLSSNPRHVKLGGRFVFATLLAASAVGGALLIAPYSVAEPDVVAESDSEDAKEVSCDEAANIKLTKMEGNSIKAEAATVEEKKDESKKCAVDNFKGQISDVVFEQKGDMCTAKSSNGKGQAHEKKPKKKGKEQDTAKNADVSIEAPLENGPDQGKFRVKLHTDPSSASQESVEAEGNFKVGKSLKLKKCDFESLPDSATVKVEGIAQVKPDKK